MPASRTRAQRVGERAPGRVADRGVEQAGRARRRRCAAPRLPGVEPDVVVIAAGGDERGVRRPCAGELEAEHAAVEIERPVDVGHLEVDVADVGARVDRLGGLAPSFAEKSSSRLSRPPRPAFR